MEWLGSWGPVYLSTLGGLLIIVAAFLSARGQIAKEKENAALNAKIVEIQQETLTQVVGSPEAHLVVFPNYGDGDPVVGGKDATRFFANNISGKPMIAVSILLLNVTEGTDGTGILYSNHLGDIHERSGGLILDCIAPLRRDVDNRFTIIVRSRRVDLSEEVVITWHDGKWVSDYGLERTSRDGSASEVIKKIRDDFPYLKERNQG